MFSTNATSHVTLFPKLSSKIATKIAIKIAIKIAKQKYLEKQPKKIKQYYKSSIDVTRLSWS